MNNTVIVLEDSPAEIITVEGANTIAYEAEPDTLIITVGEQGPAGADGADGATGSVMGLPAALDMSGHRVVCDNGAEFARYASNDNLLDAHAVLGISTNAALAGDPVLIQFAGKFVEPSWAWVPGAPVFCGVDGVLTQEVPTSGFILIVGVATSLTSVVVGIKQPIIIN